MIVQEIQYLRALQLVLITRLGSNAESRSGCYA